MINKTSLQGDFSAIVTDIENIIKNVGWGEKNQIGLNFRPGAENSWFDAVGSLYDKNNKIFIGKENDFTEFNPLSTGLKNELDRLVKVENIKFGRIRIMRLMPHCGLSVHNDLEPRYHLVIKTNPKSYFCFNTLPSEEDLTIRAQCYHIPADGHWYYADTTKIHWVYNGGETERIHLVVCALN